MKNKIFELTPLGRADRDVRDFLEEDLSKEELAEYEKRLEQFRSSKIVHLIIKSLLYAGLITSVATTIGLDQAYILQKIASYIGVTLLLVIYGFSKYFMDLYREQYHVQREIVISKAAERNGEKE